MKVLVFCWLIVLGFTCFAQTGEVKLYGYTQTVLPAIPHTPQTDEQGKTVEQKKETHANYFIYLAYPKSLVLYPVEIWMKGEVYGIKGQPAHTPVVIKYNDGMQPDNIILVPQTEKDTAIQINFSEKLPAKSTVAKKSLVEANDLVVVYRMKGKFYTLTLKKIRGLRNGIMQ